MCMKKFFTSGKFGIKNKKFASVLDALLGWSFFVVSCCTALFVYFYASENNDVAYAVSDSETLVSLIKCRYDGNKVKFDDCVSEYSFSGGYRDLNCTTYERIVSRGDDLTITCTLKTGWDLDKSEGTDKVVYATRLNDDMSSQSVTCGYTESTVNGNKQIKIELKSITGSNMTVGFRITPVKYNVKFKSDRDDFNFSYNDGGAIKVADIKFTGENVERVSDGEVNFKYVLANSFSYTVDPKKDYRVRTGKSIRTYLVTSDGNNTEIKADDNGVFSISFDDTKIKKYQSGIEILVTGIKSSSGSSIKLKTDRTENKSVPYFSSVEAEYSIKAGGRGGTTLRDDGYDFYTAQEVPDGTIDLIMRIKQGYTLKKNENGDVIVKYRKESEDESEDENTWLICKKVKVEDEKGHSPVLTVTFNLEDDVVVQVNGMEFDKYDIRFYDGDVNNGFLKLNEGDGRERVKIFKDAMNDSLTQSELDTLDAEFKTSLYFKIEPQGDYSMSRILVYIIDKNGEQNKLSPCDKKEGDYEGFYKIELNDSSINDFCKDKKGNFKDCIQIVVKGVFENFVNVMFKFEGGANKDKDKDFWSKVSSVSCQGTNDGNEQKCSYSDLEVNGDFIFKKVSIGSDKTAKIKISLDQWYKFNSKENCRDLISVVSDNISIDVSGLEKREINNNIGEGYETWYEKNDLTDVAVLELKINSQSIPEGGYVVLNYKAITCGSSGMIDGHECKINFTNEEDGLTFKKCTPNGGNQFELDINAVASKKFSEIKFGEPNYFVVEVKRSKCSFLEQSVGVDGSSVRGSVVDNASIVYNNKNPVPNPENMKVICVTINDNSDNYYPGIPADVNIYGIKMNDKFVVIEGINIEEIKESDINESKKIEKKVKFVNKENCTKITSVHNAPLSFVVKPSSGYSFPAVIDSNVLKINTVKKDGTGVGVGNENWDDYVNEEDLSGKKDKFTIESRGSSIEIKVNNMLENIYMCINSTPDKIPINFSSSEGIEYFKLDDNGKISEPLRDTVTVEKGTNEYKFAVKVPNGYDMESLKVFSNSVELSHNNNTFDQDGITYYVYTLSNIDRYTNITSSVEKLKCKLTFLKPPVGAYYTKVGSDTEITEQFTEDSILYGSNFSFCVKLKDEYRQSKLIVKFNDREIQPLSNDTYTIYNITENGTISIDDNIKLNNYTINFESSDRAEYILENNSEKVKNVEHGGNYKFKVRAKTGYILGENIAVNCVGDSGSETLTGKKISGSGSSIIYEYEIDNITENKTISVSGVEDLFYNVKLQDVEGVTYINETGAVISGTHKIAYGKNFEFSVNVDDAYDDSIPGMFIVVNEGKSIGISAQKLSSGKYVIPNVTRDITIRVGNIRKNRYTITFTKTEGIDYYDTNGKIITGDNEVEQNDSISFKVSLYPAYSDSKITVMLGDKAVTADSSDIYTIAGIDEDKTVTVIGVEKSKEAELINTINSLPNPVRTLDDANLVIEASKIYNSLSEEKKKTITNYDLLQTLQEQVKAFHHISNDVKIDGVDWYLKLVAVPISSSTEICSRIYKKLNSEYILSLYDVYLWDTLNDRRYTLPAGTTAVVSIPTPDMTYFNKPTGIHENDDGKIDYLSLTFDGGRTTFEAVTFSPFGVIANRSSTPGRSSLLDAVDANVDLIKDFALSGFGGGSSDKNGISENAMFDDTNSNSGLQIGSEDDVEGNISEKYKSRNNKVTARGSALRLILVLMIIVLISLALWILYKRRKEIRKSKK